MSSNSAPPNFENFFFIISRFLDQLNILFVYVATNTWHSIVFEVMIILMLRRSTIGYFTNS